MQSELRHGLLCLGLLLAAGGTAAGHDEGAPAVEWVRGYGGWYTEEHPHTAVQAGDDGYVIAGETTGDDTSRIFVVRTDERGTELFARSYGAGRYNLGNFVRPGGGRQHLLVAGSWDVGSDTVQEDRVLLRLAGDGEVLAMRTYPAPRRDAIEGVTVNADGTMIAVGYRDADQEELNSFIVDTGRAFVMKLDRDLGVVWERAIRGAMFQAFGVRARTDAPGYAVFGACRGSAEQTRFCISFTDDDGNAGLPIIYGTRTSHPYDFDAAHDGGFILTGHVSGCPDGCWDGFLVRVDATGRELWSVSFGEPNGGTPERMFEECYGVRAAFRGGGYVTACGSGVEPGNEARPADPAQHVARLRGARHRGRSDPVAGELRLPARQQRRRIRAAHARRRLRGVRRLRRARRRRGSQHRPLQAGRRPAPLTLHQAAGAGRYSMPGWNCGSAPVSASRRDRCVVTTNGSASTLFPASPAEEVVLVAALQRGIYQCRGGDALQLRQVAGKRRGDREATRPQHLQHGFPQHLGPAFPPAFGATGGVAFVATLPALSAHLWIVVRPRAAGRPERPPHAP